MGSYAHKNCAKKEHVEKVSCSSAKSTFFKHCTISIGEDNIEHKVEAERAKEQKGGY